ncbi:MAG: AAA family ATPase [Bacteroidales bacterium]|nr:AAA family ATPase [Bacteroidales bacterium]
MGEISERYMNLFRLRSLTVLNHPILGSIHQDFCPGEYIPDGIYTSVVIGANGIGKSNLLRILAEIFCCLENIKLEETPIAPKYYFKITYISQWKQFEFANFRDSNIVEQKARRYTNFVFKENDTDTDIRTMIIPKRVIASSTTVTDKFVAKSTEMYRYKGLRNESSPSSTGTRTMVRKTVDGLLNSLDIKYGFRRELQNLLEHLGLQPKLELTYSLKYKQYLVKRDITKSDLIHLYEHQKDIFGKRETELWGTRKFMKMKEEEEWKLDTVAYFLQKIAYKGFDDGKNMLRYDLLADDSSISEDKDAIKILSQLDILSYPSLKIYKNNQDENYPFDQSSSGESTILCQMVNIMSEIEPNSLILIDEPEASSHPNWQISYIGWLKSIFQRYYNCHFVIATHSHFILTDLEPSSSDIIALEKTKDGLIKDVSEGVNTFNWSVDDILYRVFHIRNTRNYVFESKVIELCKLVENRGSKDKAKALINELSPYKLNGDDPIVKLLKIANDYVEFK